MTTPVGWALAGGILALTLIAAASRGGREFLNTLVYAAGGFGWAMSGLALTGSPSVVPMIPTLADFAVYGAGVSLASCSFFPIVFHACR